MRYSSQAWLRSLKWFAMAVLAAAFSGCGGGSHEDSSIPIPPEDPSVPKDPLFTYQWHLHNTGQPGAPNSMLHGLAGVDLNVMPVWKQQINGQPINGRGVTVAVVDDGIEVQHEDLRANIADGLSYNPWTGGTDPTPSDPVDSHGTAVAGLIAATKNDRGGVGVAPGAKLAGFKLFNGQVKYATGVLDLLSRGADNGSIDISNNSWGPMIRGTVGGMGIDAAVHAATRHGVDLGRHGKGVVFLFAGGNDCVGTVCHLPGYGLSNFDVMREPQINGICAINANGETPGYSSFGSNLLVCAPSSGDSTVVPGITTTTLRNQYTHKFGGTSAAAPMVSGVVALMLQANPKLTWRDVRLILARTAKILPSMEINLPNDPRAQWITTKAKNPRTGKFYKYSLIYGFGLVDAQAAVEYAKNFQSVGGSSEAWWANSCDGTLKGSQVGMTTRIPLSCGSRKVELAEISIGLKHPRFRDLTIKLTTPKGTAILLTDQHPECGSEPNFQCPTDEFGDLYHTSVTVPIDEPASGNWLLEVEDKGSSGTQDIVKSVALKIH